MSQFFTWIVCTDNAILNHYDSESAALCYLNELKIHSPEAAKLCRVEKCYRTIC